MSSTVFDYAIIGAGAAGLNLALAMAREPFFSDKKILILDKEQKTDNDRTWCFWEIGSGTWDPILSHQWSTGKFITDHHNMDLKIAPYKYKMLESSSFYKYARSKLATQDNFQWAHEEVDQVLSGASVHIKTNKNQYNAGRVFDSRISPDFYKEDKFIRVLQHFKGWVIEADEDIFDPEQFVTLIKQKDARLVCLSALLTTTMPMMKQTISAIIEAGLRDQVKILVGGAPVTQVFADEIGADGYAPDAGSATRLAKLLAA